MGVRYSGAEIVWLAENWRLGSVEDTLDAFEAAFGRRPSKGSIATKACELGLRKDSAARRVAWDAARVEWFRSYAPGHTEREISAEHERLFGSPLSEGQIGNAKTRFGVKSGTHGGRFEKGAVPYNKGRSWDEQGRSPESQARSLATCFKKGEVHGPEGHVKPIGYERVDAKDGYVYVKVKDTPQANVRGRFNDNFRPKHHVAWERANGVPVPPSTMIVFADHDKRNFDPANLVAVPRSIWAVISRKGLPYRDAASLKECMALAELYCGIAKAERSDRECGACGRTFRPRYRHQATCDACLAAGKKAPRRKRSGERDGKPIEERAKGLGMDG